MSFKATNVSTAIGSIAVLLMSPISATEESFNETVKKAPQKYPYLNAEDIKKLAANVTDWVIHYEKAVIFGTGYEYEDYAKKRIFNDILDKENMCSKDINLTTCATELICNDKIFTNFVDNWKTNNCRN